MMAHGMKPKKIRIFKVLDKDPELTIDALVERFGINYNTASQYIRDHKEAKANED